MSAITDQFNAERIMIAQLALQSDLSGVNIVHFDSDTQASATSIDRIVVQAMPRTVYAYGFNLATPVLFSCMVKVTVFLATTSATTLDTYVAAIQAANTGSTPASITTLATSLFGSRGFTWHNTDEGDRTDTDNDRQASQTWEAIFGA